jgi:peptidyl-tRNA hydrolase
MAQGSEGETDALTKIIVGLGNPGDQYAQNRHNVGYMVVEALARETGARWSTCVLSQACRIEINGCRVLLAKPSTYMNHSGRIGEEQMPKNKADFVLSDFPPDRKMELDEMIVKAGNAVKSILSNGVAKTMGIFNA